MKYVNTNIKIKDAAFWGVTRLVWYMINVSPTLLLRRRSEYFPPKRQFCLSSYLLSAYFVSGSVRYARFLAISDEGNKHDFD
jgi:hypothetical protein